jgi:uncharacterized protein (TIGR03085 family)
VSTSSRERAELADLLDALGPDAPTCCAGWATAHMAAHLVVRDRRPDSLPGYGVELAGVAGPLPAWSHRLEDRLRRSTPYPDLVARLRSGPPAWSPMQLPGPLRLFSTAEFFIHHEDVRRAQPDWSPRALPRPAQDEAWGSVQFFGRLAARASKRTLVLRRTDVPGSDQRRFGRGNRTRTVSGEPVDLLLWLSGRRGVSIVEVE